MKNGEEIMGNLGILHEITEILQETTGGTGILPGLLAISVEETLQGIIRILGP